MAPPIFDASRTRRCPRRRPLGQDGADLIEPKLGRARRRCGSMSKAMVRPSARVDKLGVEVDRNWFTRGCRRDRVPVLGVVQGDGKNAVTEAVGVKDLAKETRCNDAANAEISQRPDGFARGSSLAELRPAAGFRALSKGALDNIKGSPPDDEWRRSWNRQRPNP